VTVENREFDAFARRIVRAYARRVANGDIEALPALRDLSATVDTALQEAVTGLRAFGYSWTEIATRLGVSRQAVQMRWGQRVP
jgi:DNA-directed RNA polymerase specialized sigma24 family protein